MTRYCRLGSFPSANDRYLLQQTVNEKNRIEVQLFKCRDLKNQFWTDRPLSLGNPEHVRSIKKATQRVAFVRTRRALASARRMMPVISSLSSWTDQPVCFWQSKARESEKSRACVRL
jgi:hypothetical protein